MYHYSRQESGNYHFNGVMDTRVSSLFKLPQRPADHTLRFIKTNCTLLNPFVERLNSTSSTAAVVKITKKIHKDDRRKMTGELYLKHLFYTAYLADEMTAEKEYTPDQRNLITAVSFLHDTIELGRKKRNSPNYDIADFYNLLTTTQIGGSIVLKDWDKRDIKKIVTMVSLMTPPDKSVKTPTEEWHNIKREDFYFLLNITKNEVRERAEMLGDLDGVRFSEDEYEVMARIIKDVKVAEVLANLRETADDVLWSRDGHSNPKMRDFIERYKMFIERTDYFRSLPLSDLYLAQMEADMEILHDFIRG